MSDVFSKTFESSGDRIQASVHLGGWPRRVEIRDLNHPDQVETTMDMESARDLVYALQRLIAQVEEADAERNRRRG